MTKRILGLIGLMVILSSMFMACAKDSADSTDQVIDNGGGDNNEVFTENISMTLIKNGQEITLDIKENIYSFITVDELEGYTIKKLEISTGNGNTFPKINLSFPLKVGDYKLGTTYGSEEYFRDYIILDISEEEYYYENTQYQNDIEGPWVQPWLEVLSISGSGELEAIFGGTVIGYDYDSESYQSLNINNGKIKVKIADDYPGIVDNSLSIAVDPPTGDGGGGGGQNNINADFEIRYPYSYVSGVAMLFDTATLTIINKSSNATQFEWELIQGDFTYSENYFIETTPVGLNRFQKTMRLRNMSDTCRFTVKLTAYDEFGNNKTAFRSVSLPMLHCVMYVDGVMVDDPGTIYYEEETIGTKSFLRVFGIAFEKVNTFHFGDVGFFPTPGTFLDDLHQTGDYFPSNGDLSFYLEKSYPNGGVTFDDPDSEYSSLNVDNYSIQIENAEIYKIFGSVSATYTLGQAGGNTGTVEFKYLAPESHYPLH